MTVERVVDNTIYFQTGGSPGWTSGAMLRCDAHTGPKSHAEVKFL